MRRYYYTTYTIKVLSEDAPVTNLSPSEVVEAIDTGDCVGDVNASAEEVTAEEMSELLVEFGSCPEFFQLEDIRRCLACAATGSRGEFEHDPEAPRCPECGSIDVGPYKEDE